MSPRGRVPRQVAHLPAPRVAATALIAVIVLTTVTFGAAQRLKRAAPIIDPTEVRAVKLFSPGSPAARPAPASSSR